MATPLLVGYHAPVRSGAPMDNAALRDLIEARTGDVPTLRRFLQKRLPDVFRELSPQATLTDMLNDVFRARSLPVVGQAARKEWPGAFDPPRRIFICYRRTGLAAELAPRLASALAARGKEVFLDVGMTPGTAWRQEINRQIDTSDVFVILLAPDTGDSEMVLGELERAVARHEDDDEPWIFPVRLGFEERLAATLALHLEELQYFLWQSPRDEVELVRQICREAPVPETAPSRLAAEPPSVATIMTLGTRSPVGPNDRFFVPRHAAEIEAFVRGEACGTIVLNGPNLVGKTSVAMHAIDLFHQRSGDLALASAHVDLQGFSRRVKSYGEFQYHVSRAIQGAVDGPRIALSDFVDDTGLENFLDDVVTEYDELLLVLDGVDQVSAKAFSSAFYGLIRGCTDRRSLFGAHFSKKIRLLVIASSEPEFLIDNTNQSLLTVGYPMNLTGFTVDDCRELNRRCESLLSDEQVVALQRLLGGQPLLCKRAMLALFTGRGLADEGRSVADRWETLHREASDPHGLFGEHLLATAKRLMDADLLHDFNALMRDKRVDDRRVRVLRQMGLVRPLGSGKWGATSTIYREYLRTLK